MGKNETKKKILLLFLYGGFIMLAMPSTFAVINETSWWTAESILIDNGTGAFNLTEDKGTMAFVTGKVGDSAFDFTVDDRLINIDYGGNADNLTVACWVNLDVTDANMKLLDFKFDTSGARVAGLEHGATSIINVLCDDGQRELIIDTTGWEGTWFHIAWTCQLGGFMKMYFNGTLNQTDTVALTSSTEITHIIMGGTQGDVDEYDGQLDDCRVYTNTTINTIDIAALFNNGAGRGSSLNDSLDIKTPEINITLNDTSLMQFNVVNVSANISDDIGLDTCQIIINQTGADQFFNFTLSGIADQCSQNFTINNAEDFINFTIKVNDTPAGKFNQSSFFVSIADATVPIIHSFNFTDTSIVDGSVLNLTINVSDLSSPITTIIFNLTNPDGIPLQRINPTFFTIPSNTLDFILNYTIFETDETSVVGVWNWTYLNVSDSAGNEIATYPNITFDVTAVPPPEPGVSTSGGGGGAVSAQCSLSLFRPKDGGLINMVGIENEFTKETDFEIRNLGADLGTYSFTITDNEYLKDNCILGEQQTSIKAGLGFTNTISCKVADNAEKGLIRIKGCGEEKNLRLQLSSNRLLAFFSLLFSGDNISLLGFDLSPFVFLPVAFLTIFVAVPIVVIVFGRFVKWGFGG